MTREAAPAGDLSVLDAVALRRWALLVLVRLEEHREAIDALNVFPVPDGDTGSNLHRTWAAALDGKTAGAADLSSAGSPDADSPGEQVAALAHATLLAARGNSGVLLGQLVQGLAQGLMEADAEAAPPIEPAQTLVGVTQAGDELPSKIGIQRGAAQGAPSVIGPQQLARAFVLADERAWAAVSDPVEGTILSVSRLAAQAAQAAASHGMPLAEVTGAALGGAERALAATPAQLPSLARAGVVDAGGAGLVVILAALHEVVTAERVRVPIPAPHRRASANLAGLAPADGPARFEVMYVVGLPTPPARFDDGEPEVMSDSAAGSLEEIDARRSVAEALRTRLDGIGDSVVLGGRAEHLTVHVHTDVPGRAVECGLSVGAVSDIRIELLTESLPESNKPSIHDPDVVGQARVGASRALGVVVCASGSGLSRLFADAGANVVADSPGARATPQAILAAVRESGGERVVVLPNDRDTRMAAGAAVALAAEQGRHAEVLPSESPVQAVAALALYDPDTDPASTVRAMTQAAEGVRAGRVTLASRRALTAAGWCEPGDALGIVHDEVIVLGPDPVAVSLAVVNALAAAQSEAEPEIVTLICGDGAHSLGEAVEQAVIRALPEVDVTVIHGDQPVYTLLVGVE